MQMLNQDKITKYTMHHAGVECDKVSAAETDLV